MFAQLLSGLVEPVLVKAGEGREVSSGVSGQSAFREVGDPCATLGRAAHLPLDPAQVPVSIVADGKLACREYQLTHRSHRSNHARLRCSRSIWWARSMMLCPSRG